MADTVLAPALQVQKWLGSYFQEYVRTSGFLPYMGRGTNSIIQTRYELTDGGKSINIPLVTRLKAAGVTGTTALLGAEEALGTYNQNIAVDYLRNGVKISDPDRRYAEFDLLGAAQDMLKIWSADKLRTDIINALGSIDGVTYASATAGQRNSWTANNADRVLFGTSKANYNATHATALANIAASQKLSTAVVSLMKRIARTADPFIRPFRTEDGSGREYYVMFAGSNAFRDLQLDTAMQQANRDARDRGVDTNPIFQSGDLIWDGVIIREIPEIPATGNVGATSATVAPVYLCGAQSVGIAWGQEPKAIFDDTDYKMWRHVGTQEVRGIQKMRFLTGAGPVLKDHGMVTGFVGAAADA